MIFAALAVGGYYIYSGISASVDRVGANRARPKPKATTAAGLSRAEADRQRSQRVANYVGASSGLAEHNNRTQQTQNTIDQLTNSNQR